MIWVTLEVSTGGNFTNLEKVWKPGAQTLMFLEENRFSASNSCKARNMALSRVASCTPSCPSDLVPQSRIKRPPASLISKSATLMVAAPKSTAKNDLLCNILILRRHEGV